MNQCTVTVPVPPSELWPNRRPHYTTKASKAKRYRFDCMCCAVDASGNTRPHWKNARVTIRAFFQTKRRRDRDNLIAALKAAFDGCIDAGLMGDDSGLVQLPPEMLHDPANPRVELVFEEDDPR